MSDPAAPPHRAFKAILLGLVLLVALGALEIGLRMVPSAIGLSLLSRFEPGLRAEIAEDLGIRTRRRLLELPSSDRVDGGPPIFRMLPLTENPQYNEPADIAAGAEEVVYSDEIGFCNPPGLIEEAPFDVAMVGDSFTFCTSVAAEATAAYGLAEATGLGVYNLGVSGVGPHSYLELLRSQEDVLQPRVAVMNIYEGNDLRDTVRHYAFLEEGGDDDAPDPDARPAWSYALQFLRANVILARDRFEGAMAPERNINFRYSAPVGGEELAMNPANKDRDEVVHAMGIQSGELSFDLFREPLLAYIDWAEETGVVPNLTYIPSMYSAYSDTVTFEDPETGRIVMAFSDAQRAWFAAFAEETGLRFVDLTPAFREATSAGVLTHFPGNVHLTPEGHDVVVQGVRGLVTEALDTPETGAASAP